jgi:hypothetical protein
MGEGGIGGSAARSVEETADGEESVSEKGHTQEGSGQQENGTDAKEGLVWRGRKVVMAAPLGRSAVERRKARPVR